MKFEDSKASYEKTINHLESVLEKGINVEVKENYDLLNSFYQEHIRQLKERIVILEDENKKLHISSEGGNSSISNRLLSRFREDESEDLNQEVDKFMKKFNSKALDDYELPEDEDREETRRFARDFLNDALKNKYELVSSKNNSLSDENEILSSQNKSLN
ncbi:MAG: hypothetical protein Q4Q32_04215, partial [Methanobrevibacter sp.]|nr:hypothetical protein [Methanobrevibacter sp.]